MNKIKINQYIKHIEKELHKFDSGGREKDGKKIVIHPQVDIKTGRTTGGIEIDNRLVLVFWFGVGYREKNRKEIYVSRKEKVIRLAFPDTKEGERNVTQLAEVIRKKICKNEKYVIENK